MNFMVFFLYFYWDDYFISHSFYIGYPVFEALRGLERNEPLFN